MSLQIVTAIREFLEAIDKYSSVANMRKVCIAGNKHVLERNPSFPYVFVSYSLFFSM